MSRTQLLAAAVAFVTIAGGCLVLTAQPINDEDVTAAMVNDHVQAYMRLTCPEGMQRGH